MNDKLIVRAESYTRPGQLSRKVGDICLNCYGKIDEFSDENHLALCIIPRSVATDENTFNDALTNTLNEHRTVVAMSLMPAISSIDDLVRVDIFSDSFTEFKQRNVQTYVITWSEYIHGATCVFIPKVVERLYNVFGEEYYVVFTSIHEALVHPVSIVEDVNAIRYALRETNIYATLETEKLSDNVYKYNAAINKIEMVED